MGELFVIESMDNENLARLQYNLALGTEVVALDTEVSSLDFFTSKLYLIQIEVAGDIYIFNCLKIPREDWVTIVSMFQDHKCIGHNIKFDIKVLMAQTGIRLRKVSDTMILEKLIEHGLKSEKKFYSYEELVTKYTGAELDKSVRESFYADGILTEITQEQIVYSALDVKYLKDIHSQQLMLLDMQGQNKIVDIEDRLIPGVARMEYQGITLVVNMWKDLMDIALKKSSDLSTQILDNILGRIDFSKFKNLYDARTACKVTPKATKKLEKELSEITDKDFYKGYLRQTVNINSTTQLPLLLRMIGFTDIVGTAEEVLYEMKDRDPIFKMLSEYREWFKKGTSFGQKFIDMVNPITGRLHAEFDQVGTDSGRFACEKPNLQQILSIGDYRACFVARPGYKLGTFDYSQQELRIAAGQSKEPKFIQAFLDGKDLHAISASELFDVPFEEVTKALRSIGKGFNFAVLYGSTEWGLAYNFKIKVQEALRLRDKFYKSFPVLTMYKRIAERYIMKLFYSTTVLGRKRFFDRYIDAYGLSVSMKDKEKLEAKMLREGFNHIIQGTGADISKLAMIYIDERNPYGDDLIILMAQHDELVVEIKDEILDEGVKFVSDMMLEAEAPFIAPVPPEIGIPKVLQYWAK